jgi:hypothetical protein
MGVGRISGDKEAAVRAQNCSVNLLAKLSGQAIPPGPSIAVVFQVDVFGNEAINVDLAGG